MASTRRAGVVGHPVAHSLSPALHHAAYDALGLDWSYDAIDVEPGGLASFVAGLGPEWAGLSVTMPHKADARALAEFVEPMAKLLGVANTLLLQPVAGGRQIVGANTDVAGVHLALSEAGVEVPQAPMVLGGGATATAAVAALGELGARRIAVAVRSRGRAGGLLRAATAMGLDIRFVTFEDAPALLTQADAVVSTVPVDAGAALGESISDVTGVLLDAVYEPLVTPLGSSWEAHGGVRVGGERMLLHQACEQVRLMTDRNAPIQDMEDALLRALVARGEDRSRPSASSGDSSE